MSDGCRLAARCGCPTTPSRTRFPPSSSICPIGGGDGTAARDAINQPYLAGHGYACLRIDIRGSGDSDGFFDDEYSPQEQEDCVEAIAWIAAQPWCTGAVGMWGISWGGFNALQVAAHRPPALKAIITVCSTDDRYADDTHYMGGCLLLGNLNWGANMFGIATKPPDPEVVGERWRDIWLERLETHPASRLHLDEPPAARRLLAAGLGLRGLFGDRMRRLRGRRLGGFLHQRHPTPARRPEGAEARPDRPVGACLCAPSASPVRQIGFLQELLRWWDYWLKGHDTGIMREPLLRAYMQEAVPPASYYDEMPGRWVAEEDWPSPRIAIARWFLTADGTLADEAGAAEHQSRSPRRRRSEWR